MALVTAPAALAIPRAAVRTSRPASSGVRLTARGRRVVALLALLPVVVAFLLLGTRLAQAETAVPTTAVVKIEAGQSLWDVAVAIAPNQDPRRTIWTIRALNGLDSSEVQAGQALIVPVS